MDGTIPRRHLARVLGAIEQTEDEFGLRCANVFHAGDGNLHPLILFDSNKPDEVERAEQFGAAILELCVQVGGTLTGEHGVGMEKINQMCVQFSRDELDAFLAVKRRSEEHTSELQSLMRISYAVFCLKKKKKRQRTQYMHQHSVIYYMKQSKNTAHSN